MQPQQQASALPRAPAGGRGAIPRRGGANNGGGSAPTNSLSSSNPAEAEFILSLLRCLHAWRGVDPRTGQRQKFTGSVGLITFYRAQLGLLRGLVEEHFTLRPSPGEEAASVSGSVGCGGCQASGASGNGSSAAAQAAAAPTKPTLKFTLDINTVDGFQGQERDIIILSCVRTVDKDDMEPFLPAGDALPTLQQQPTTTLSQQDPAAVTSAAPAAPKSAIGFLDDPRRINVALTRAKFGCWVVGHGPALQTSLHWRAFLQHCSESGAIIQVPDQKVEPKSL